MNEPPLFQGLEPAPDYTYKWIAGKLLPVTGPDAKPPPGTVALWQDGVLVGFWPEDRAVKCIALLHEDGSISSVWQEAAVTRSKEVP